EWIGLAGGEDAAARERSLLALAGQFGSVGLRPALPQDAVRRPPLPRLAAPAVPEGLRPVLRSALAVTAVPAAVIRMVARRGFVVHPADWFPDAAQPGTPEVYRPWLTWLSGAPRTPGPSPEVPDADAWRLMGGAEQVAEMKRLRAEEPAQAVEVMAGLFKQLPAVRRQALLEVLAEGLGEADAEFLSGLEQDRSAPVRERARAFLARLGSSGTADSEEARELAEFFNVTVKRGLRRRTVVATAPAASAAAARRRDRLFEAVTLPQLASALGLEPDALIEAWAGEPRKGVSAEDAVAAARGVAELVAASGSDSQAEALASKLVAAKEPAAAAALFNRVGRATQARIAAAGAGGDRDPAVLEPMARAADADLLGPGHLGPVLRGRWLAEGLALGAAEAAAEHRGRYATALATLMTGDAAHDLLANLEAQGVPRATPGVAALVLNTDLCDAARASQDHK
ncbi:MAG: DUF5691 domain-containing protein, partial [Bifidobacteriaceae bacterium]|nr:DUF5691 domain-containing protein [Bifidobacteriaceae bacterium]